MPPIWTFTDANSGERIAREMTADEWAAYPQATDEIVTGEPDE